MVARQKITLLAGTLAVESHHASEVRHKPQVLVHSTYQWTRNHVGTGFLEHHMNLDKGTLGAQHFGGD